MRNDKLYFENEDALNCYPLEDHLQDAKLEGLKSVTIMEAIPDDGTNDYVWCTIYDAVEKSNCTKSQCSRYESKSGRGKCSNKGNLYLHGEKITFDTETGQELNTSGL